MMNKEKFMPQDQDHFTKTYEFAGQRSRTGGYSTLEPLADPLHLTQVKRMNLKYKIDHAKNLKKIMFRSKNKDYPISPGKRPETSNEDLPPTVSKDGRTHIVGGKIVINDPRTTPSILSLTDGNRGDRIGSQLVSSATNEEPSVGAENTKSLENVHGPKMQELTNSRTPSSIDAQLTEGTRSAKRLEAKGQRRRDRHHKK